MITREIFRVLVSAALAIALAGCFVSDSLLERERIWDPAWFGRYEADGVMFVVLPDDPVQRTYLIGEFDNGQTKIDTYRAALYRGWGDTFILGHLKLGNDKGATYTLLRRLTANRVASRWPDCDEDFADRHELTRESEVCKFTSLETLRSALQTYDLEHPATANDEPKPLDRRRDHPLSTIGVTARAGVFSDSEGVHGGLKLIDVPPRSPAARAGLRKGDMIFAVGDPRPAIGEELFLRIAAATPGSVIKVTYFHRKTHAKRQVTVVTAPLD